MSRFAACATALLPLSLNTFVNFHYVCPLHWTIYIQLFKFLHLFKHFIAGAHGKGHGVVIYFYHWGPVFTLEMLPWLLSNTFCVGVYSRP